VNKNALRALIAASLLTVGAAQATDTSATVQLKGELPKSCSVGATGGSLLNINLTDTNSVQGNEVVTATCNYNGVLKIAVTSANQGKLVTTENGGASVAYQVMVPGTNQGVALTGNGYSYDQVPTGLGTQNLKIKLMAAATRAGIYSDTITIKVATN